MNRIMDLAKLSFLAGTLGMSQVASANQSAEKVWITVGNDTLSSLSKNFAKSVELSGNKSNDGIALVQVDAAIVPELSHLMHDEFNRCGGFMVHDSLEAAEAELYGEDKRWEASKMLFVDYTIDQDYLVKPMIESVEEKNIATVIRKLSSFQNRYYQGNFGQASQQWVKEHWQSLVQGRNDVTVEFVKHPKWAQPSVVMTIQGKSPETIVIGGHADSIAGFMGRESARAPGADDNASGIATITEVIRVVGASSYQPQKTIKFMAYAAEELGLLGSKEIAQTMRSRNAAIVGVLQLDMTNYKGSAEDIVMMDDFTNKAQNAFLGTLIDHYLPGIKWGYDSCGYACSDHASWHSQGFPASIPFESKSRSMNGKIHTANDTIEVSGGNALHATKFAKLALAFLVELDQ